MVINSQILTRSIGKRIENHEGVDLGVIEEIKFDSGGQPKYLVLCCNKLHGTESRYFGVRLEPNLVDTTRGGEVVIRIDKKVLQISLGVQAGNCQDGYDSSVFEIYSYADQKSK